jgi:adenine phosphoribosyltransferase
MDIREIIREVPDFPQPGILFRDITPVMEDPAALAAALDGLGGLIGDVEFDKFAAMESRGFLFGAPLAVQMNRGLVLLRKAGKLPCPTEQETYALEYGEAALEVHRDALAEGERVVVIDDLLATGGTAQAAGRLVRKLGAEVAAYLFLVELKDLSGRDLLTDAPVLSLVAYD